MLQQIEVQASDETSARAQVIERLRACGEPGARLITIRPAQVIGTIVVDEVRVPVYRWRGYVQDDRPLGGRAYARLLPPVG